MDEITLQIVRETAFLRTFRRPALAAREYFGKLTGESLRAAQLTKCRGKEQERPCVSKRSAILSNYED